VSSGKRECCSLYRCTHLTHQLIGLTFLCYILTQVSAEAVATEEDGVLGKGDMLLFI